MNAKRSVSIIGLGNMGMSILNGILSSSLNLKINALSRSKKDIKVKKGFIEHFHGDITNHIFEIIATSEFIILAVKPSQVIDLLRNLKKTSSHLKVEIPPIVSVVAGVEVAAYKQILGQKHPVIRTMPNTPAAVCESITGVFADRYVTSATKDLVVNIFEIIGKVTVFVDEEQMHNFTAIAGSAPAYYFLFAEYLMNSAIQMGFDEEIADLITKQVLLGSAQLVSASNKSLITLREEVTSPNGTTFAAIETFKNLNLDQLVAKAVSAGVARSKEIAKEGKM